MAENDGQETTESLRGKLEKALADLAATNQTLAAERADRAFSGLEVSDRQRKIILRELSEDKLDITPDNVKSVAKDLGFAQAPPPPPPAGDGQQQPPPNGNGNDQQGNQGQPSVGEDGDILVSLNEMNVIDRANYNARRGNISPDLDTEMRNAKSPEELTQIIRTKGAASGLVHEWDTT